MTYALSRNDGDNTAQGALSRQIVAGRPGECKKSNFEVFSCRHFNFKNSAPGCTRTRHFHSKKIEKITNPLGAYGALTRAPLTLDPWSPFTKS